jgi:predicted acylesterase/phospholipase RssA
MLKFLAYLGDKYGRKKDNMTESLRYIGRGFSKQRATWFTDKKINIGGNQRVLAYPSKLAADGKTFMRRLSHPLVQRRICNELGISLSQIDSLIIDPLLRTNMKFSMGRVFLKPDFARKVIGDGFGLVLGGGTDRIFAHLGVLEELEKAGIKPDFIVGTSAGSIIGALYAYYGSVQRVKELIYKAMEKNGYQEIGDLNLDKMRDGKMPSGLLKGDKLLKMLEDDLGLKGVKFSELKIPLIITGVEANDGLLYLFADRNKVYDELKDDPRTMKKSRYKITRLRFYEGPITVAQACRISSSLPGGAVPYRTVYKKKVYDWIDGGIRQNNPVSIMAKLIGIKDILLSALGYCGPSKKKSSKYGDRNPWANLMHALDIEGWRQLDDLKDNDYKDEDISVRGINTGSFNIQTPQGFKLAQRLVISAKESVKQIIRLVCGKKFSRKVFFSEWNNRKVRKLENEGINFEEYSRGGRGVYFMSDQKSAIMTKPKDHPWWTKMFKKDGGKLKTKQENNKPLIWLFNILRKSWGLPWTLWTGFYAVTVKLWFFRNKMEKKLKDKIKHEINEELAPTTEPKAGRKVSRIR